MAQPREKCSEYVGIFLKPSMKAALVQHATETGLSVSWLVRSQLNAQYGGAGPRQSPLTEMPKPRGVL